MMASKHILIIFTMFIIFSHLIKPSVSYKYISYNYETGLNSSVALTVMMTLGTPPQWQRMVIDTGSELSWSHCRNNNPSFKTNASSSFSNVACNDTVCVTETTQIANCSSVSMNCLHDLCRYSYGFTDGTNVDGNLVREKFTFSSSQVTPSMIVGCSPKKDKESGADGMLGMNRGRLSFISQVKGSQFSYCVPLCANVLNISSGSSSSSSISSNSNCATGKFYLGNNPYFRSFRYINLLNTSEQEQGQLGANFDHLAYYVRFVNISIKGEKLNIIDDRYVLNPNESRVIMIDSGTRHTYLVDGVYNAVREKVVNLTSMYINKKIMVGGQYDMCFDAKSNLSDIVEKIGDLVFEFENGVKVTIPKERTLDKINDELGYCVAIGRSSFLLSSINFFGYYFQQNLCLHFDIQGNRVGFGNANGSH